MKMTCLLASFATAICCFGKTAAQTYSRVHTAELSSRQLEVTSYKTTSLIFPAAITNVDRGSDDIIIQKAAAVENVLRVKAASDGFDETNLSVITSDGRFYHFNVRYNARPAVLAFQVDAEKAHSVKTPLSAPAPVSLSAASTNETYLRQLAAQASIERRNIRNEADNRYETGLKLTGLYLYRDWFLYKLIVSNTSAVTYNIQELGFHISDAKKVKRTATQEIQLEPVMVIGSEQPVAGNSERMIIAILPKQVIAGDKRLVITLNEKNGGRNLKCGIPTKTLLKARPIQITKAVESLPNVTANNK